MELGGSKRPGRVLEVAMGGIGGIRGRLRGSLKGLKSELETSGGPVKGNNGGGITRTWWTIAHCPHCPKVWLTYGYAVFLIAKHGS